jgi:hypothetical protein
MDGLTCQDVELKAEMYGENPSKTLEKLGLEKYVSAKITRVNTVFIELLFVTFVIQDS